MTEPKPGDRGKRLSPETWAAARRAYEIDGVPKAEIARRIGVTSGSVRKTARRDGWISPNDVQGLSRLDGDGLTRLVGRLYRAFEAEIARLERHSGVGAARTADSGPGNGPSGGEGAAEAAQAAAAAEPAPEPTPEPTPDPDANPERAARTLASLARTLDTLIALKQALPDTTAERVENDVLRAELERRLARLGAAGPAAGVPGGADNGRADVPEA